MILLSIYLAGIIVYPLVFFPLNKKYKWITKTGDEEAAIVACIIFWPLAVFIWLGWKLLDLTCDYIHKQLPD